MQNTLKKILLISIFVTSLSFLDCKSSVKNYPVAFVDRDTVFSSDKKPNPLMLVIEATEDGKSSVNKIETGTIDDVTLLSKNSNLFLTTAKKHQSTTGKW
ncbi:hypothetical protein BH24ACI2_BH24ACI2_00320 [soil metagenome]|nr:hypothetical protein [Acidobacteriota bacterium]